MTESAFDPKPLSKSELKLLRGVLDGYRQTLTAPAAERLKFYDPVRDGVTYSVLAGWRQCREMARLNLHGVTSRASSVGLVYGSIAHGALQTVYDAYRRKRIPTGVPTPAYVGRVLQATEALWKRENPRASQVTLQHLEFSMALAEATMPRYFTYWKDDFSPKLNWIGIEREFRVPVEVPVTWQRKPFATFVRGKMDGNFLLRHKERLDKASRRFWLFETKSKYSIDEETIELILPHELQVNIYMWAMERLHGVAPSGVRYNLIRRPGLRQRKQEDMAGFAKRCAADVLARPDWYFQRMDMDVERQDLDRFHDQFMDLLSDFLGWWYGHNGHYLNSGSCENRYGKCHYLPACGARQMATFYKRDTVFRELEEA